MIKVLTEGSSKFGFGHIIRCLTIVNYCRKNNIEVSFVVDGDSTSQELIENNGGVITNWKNLEYIDSEIGGNDIVIMDSYNTNLEQINKINEKAKRVCIIDDINRLNFENIVFVNPNFSATELSFTNQSNVYLVGSDYVMLREEFVGVKFNKFNKTIKKVLITLGGSDVNNLTPVLMKYFKENHPNLELNIVVGFGYNNIEEIKSGQEANNNLFYNLKADEMVKMMIDNDIVVCAAGQTVNEIIKLGVPACFIEVIDNQKININYLNHNDMGVVVNELSDIKRIFDNEYRLKLFKKLSKVDNNTSGAQNIVEYLIKEVI